MKLALLTLLLAAPWTVLAVGQWYDPRNWNLNPKGAIDSLSGWMKDVAEAIAGAIAAAAGQLADIVTTLKDVVIWMLQLLVNAIGDASTAVSGALTWFLQLIATTIWEAATALKDAFTTSLALLITGLGDGFGYVRDALVWFLQLLINGVTDGFGAVRDALTWFLQLLVNAVGDGAGAIRDVVVTSFKDVIGALDRVTDAVQGITVASFDAVINAIKDGFTWVRDAITSAVNGLANRVTDAGLAVADKVEHVPDRAFEYTRDHWEDFLVWALYGAPGVAAKYGLTKLYENQDHVVDALRVSGSSINDWSGKAFQEIMEVFAGHGHIEPEDAFSNAVRALAVATGLGMAAHAPAALKDLIPFVDNTGTAYLSAFLARLSGWNEAIDASLGTNLYVAIGEPMQDYFREQHTTSIPDVNRAAQLFAGRKISETDYLRHVAYAGYEGRYYDPLERSAYRRLNRMELATIADNSEPDQAAWRAMLEASGYAPQWIDPLVKSLMARGASDGKSNLRSALLAAATDGLISVEDLAARLSFLGASQDTINYLTETARLRNYAALAADLVTAWRQAYVKGYVDDGQLEALFAGLGMTEDRVNVELERAYYQRAEKVGALDQAVKKRLEDQVKATYARAWREEYLKGLITDADLQARLVYIGFDPALAAALTEAARASAYKPPPAAPVEQPWEVEARAMKLYQQAYVDQYLAGQLEESGLRAALLATGMAAQEADATVRLAQVKKQAAATVLKNRTLDQVHREVTAVWKAAYLEQFRKGQLTAAGLASALTALGIDPQVVNGLVADAVAQAAAFPEDGTYWTAERIQSTLEQIYKSAYLVEFSKGLITEDELRAALVGLAMPPDVVEAEIALAIARLQPKAAATSAPA